MVFITVVLLRLCIPLLIPRFALPAILAALVIDAADQTIFQQLCNPVFDHCSRSSRVERCYGEHRRINIGIFPQRQPVK